MNRRALTAALLVLSLVLVPCPVAAQMAPWTSRVQGWIYPAGTCTADDEYRDGRVVHVLKPQYFTAQKDGSLYQLTVAADGCNAYSATNAAEVKARSREQYVTVAGTAPNMRAVLSTNAKRNAAVNKLVNFAVSSGFTGVEIDFEQVYSWSATDYTKYKQFLTQLGNALHAQGKKLMIDCPPVVTDSGSYIWRWQDFNALPVDHLVVMEYDWQFDFGAGTPVSPFARERSITQGVLARITDPNRVVVGIPSYGYHGPTGSTSGIVIDTNAKSRTYPGYATATRDPNSGELFWTSGKTTYNASDSESLNQKRALLESLGVRHVSVWHLGGNQWFSGRPEPN